MQLQGCRWGILSERWSEFFDSSRTGAVLAGCGSRAVDGCVARCGCWAVDGCIAGCGSRAIDGCSCGAVDGCEDGCKDGCNDGCIAWMFGRIPDRTSAGSAVFSDFSDSFSVVQLSGTAAQQAPVIRHCVMHDIAAKNKDHLNIVTQLLMTGGC